MSQCVNCCQKFNFFKKPVTCGNCNFAFCSNCCNQKTNVPSKENKLMLVCGKCNAQLTKNNKIDDEIILPKNFIKLIESNKAKEESKASQPSVIKTEYCQDLAETLNDLKKQDKSIPQIIPTEKELEERLLRLTYGNKPPPKPSFSSNILVEDKIKTPEDLLDQLKNEADLDKKYHEYEENELEKLENRVKNLGIQLNDNKKETSSSILVDTEDQKTNELVKKLLKEIEDEQEQEEKDPWCCMCNADADIKCLDCENDFYCAKCFKKCHIFCEFKDHRVKKLKNSTNDGISI